MAKSVEFWRGYFIGQNLDICDIIENAVIVAGLDYPKELKLRRDHIAELLFTCNLTKCFGCDGVELSKPINCPDKETVLEGEKNEKIVELGEDERRSKQSDVECFGDDDDANVNYIEAEALDDEVEEESNLIGEVFRIKEILDSHKEESDSTLFDSLGKLQGMDLSVEILKATEIGKSVNGLKKHGSTQIRELVHALIKGWISLLDSWMNAAAAIPQNTSPESMKTSTVDFDEGPASPPLDEGALNIHSVELPKNFDGMDNHGNPTTNGDVNNNCGSSRKSPVKDSSVPKQKHQQQQQQLSNDLVALEDKKVQQTMKEENITKTKRVVVKLNKPSCGVSGSMRPTKTRAEQKVSSEMKSEPKSYERAVQKKSLTPEDDVNIKQREQQSANGAIRKKSLTPQQEKVQSSEEASVRVKLEAAKRKLQDRYQEAENAKKQRTIKVMELHDIQKQQGSGINHIMEPGRYIRRT